MKTLFKTLLIILFLVVALVIALPFFIPTDALFNKVSQQVEQTTGRTLSIAGEKNLSVFPALKLELNDVSLSNMQGGSQPNMAHMAQLEVHIPWLSLFSGEFELEKFVIREPDILLETNAAGKANWQLVKGEQQSDSNPSSSGKTTLPEGVDVQLGEVAIYGGKVTYLDGKTGQKQQISELDLAVILKSLYQPLELKGSVNYMNERFELDLVLTNLANAIEGTPFKLTQTLNSSLVNVTFSGDITEQGQQINGELSVKGESVKKLAAWQGVKLEAKDNAFNAFNLDGKMQFKGQTLTVEQLIAKLDQLEIKGQSSIKLGERLNVNANVDLGMLDLNPYLPEQKTQPAAANEQDKNAPAQPIEWDNTPIDLSALNSLDANVVVRSSGLKAQKTTLGSNQLTLKLAQGLATISLDKFNAYQGKGKGSIKINAKQKPYRIHTQFALTDIAAQPLLSDAADFDKLMGKGSLQWQFNTQGQSQKDFVGALAGNMRFNFADGAVKGANLAELVRQAKELIKGDTSALAKGLDTGFDHAKKTDFSALSGSFVFKQGIGTNTDLKLLSPLIRITGEGKVELPSTYVDYRLVTGIVESIEGQSTTDKSTGFKIPVRIKGKFHDVKVKVDASKAAEEKVKEKLKEKVQDKLKGKLKGLFG